MRGCRSGTAARSVGRRCASPHATVPSSDTCGPDPGRIMALRHTLFSALSCILALSGCMAPNPTMTLAPDVDLTRYAGRWYIIANVPYFAERGKVGSYFDVSFPNGKKVVDVYNGRSGNFSAAPSQFTMHGYV